MPKYVFGGLCKYGDAHEKEAIRAVLLSETPYLCPFIIRSGGTLYAFTDLRKADGPFRNIVDRRRAGVMTLASWLNHPDRSRWLVTMLNRTLNKLTGRKGLTLDKEHHRYFFEPEQPGREKIVEYRPLNQSFTSRKVVWRPVRKKTNEPRPFWNHLAVNLRFLNVGAGKDGDLYGATSSGGSEGYGTIVKLSRTGKKTILYNFTGGADGGFPQNALTLGPDGNFYGATSSIFRITPEGDLTVLYTFQGPPNDILWPPTGPLAVDGEGNIYGVGLGGANSSCNADLGCGAVFELNTVGVETILYNFSGSPDGAWPYGPIVFSNGVVYGTTLYGGDSTCSQGPPAPGCGVAYSLNAGTETILYTFEDSGGITPNGLIGDAKGNFYGVTFTGGNKAGGVLFEMTPGQNGWAESVLHNFGAKGDGTDPMAGLLLDQAGDVYGTTGSTDRHLGAGSVYKVTAAGKETILHDFVFNKGNGRAPGGQFPGSGVVSLSKGVLYGTTSDGGSYPFGCTDGCGVVFRVER